MEAYLHLYQAGYGILKAQIGSLIVFWRRGQKPYRKGKYGDEKKGEGIDSGEGL